MSIKYCLKDNPKWEAEYAYNKAKDAYFNPYMSKKEKKLIYAEDKRLNGENAFIARQRAEIIGTAVGGFLGRLIGLLIQFAPFLILLAILSIIWAFE